MTIQIEQGIYDEKLINMITDILLDGKVIIMPSDTIYGFLCIPEAETKLREIKNRDKKPFIHLIDDFDTLTYLKIESEPYMEILSKNWPGPYTFLLRNIEGTIFGVRMPDWNILRGIIKNCCKPLLSTSVNLSGMSAMNEIQKIINLFGNKADLIINDTEFNGDIASTIADLCSGDVKIVREGSFPLKL